MKIVLFLLAAFWAAIGFYYLAEYFTYGIGMVIIGVLTGIATAKVKIRQTSPKSRE